jgi:hypothetical protein
MSDPRDARCDRPPGRRRAALAPSPAEGPSRRAARVEPALILISGELRARYVASFARDAAGAVAHAFEHPGYLGGLAITSSPLNTTSCSCWRTYADARDYAYGPGGHRHAMQRDRARGHHRTEYFLRLRPLAERGSLDGAAPLASALGQSSSAIRAAATAAPSVSTRR